MNVRNWFAYIPWILMTAANIVLDVVATIHFVENALESEVSPSELAVLNRPWEIYIYIYK